VDGFDDCGYDVFEKRARLAENLLPHDLIVTGGLGLRPVPCPVGNRRWAAICESRQTGVRDIKSG
jgi:hypothetical protein